ncbi:hypothetical protein D9613_008561 [Agrocybe pediades]|uniref:Uncharacterized protein n=1 Tax=Agrocybe pediades TaxID=84607 RepID=A0A8H4QU67_9AGAR|nr:hypothetical protein D9613_008561 [Agrocybe pediades]
MAIAISSVVSIHPNVPSRDAKTGSSNGTLKRVVLILWTLVAPEIVILWALRQWIGARRLAEEFKGSLSFSTGIGTYSRCTGLEGQGWTTAHGHLMQMGGFVLYDETHRAIEILEPKRFRQLLLDDWIEFPRITEAEIRDIGKSDALFKGFAIIQGTWLVIHCASRLLSGYMITGIELIALTSIISNAVLYWLWWDKPLDVRCPVPVYLLDGTDKEKAEIKPDAMWNRNSSLNIFGNLREMSGLSEMEAAHRTHSSPFHAIPADISVKSMEAEERTVHVVSAVAGVTSTIFYLSWLFGTLSFSTHAERIAWQACSVAVAICTVALLLHARQGLNLQRKRARFLLDVYVIAHVLLTLASLLSLKQLPPSAYNAVWWTSYLPHI